MPAMTPLPAERNFAPVSRSPASQLCPLRGSSTAIAEEVGVGFIFNDIPYAVMMATPSDLEDFAVGFSLTEHIIGSSQDVRRIECRVAAAGIELAIDLAPAALRQFLQRRRLRARRGHTSCGVCGIEQLEELAWEPERVELRQAIAAAAITRAVATLRDFQPLSRATRCAHAAAWADVSGELVLVREDIGRHNALDKLIGGCLRQTADLSEGFCLVTSRCSFEMVQKALAAGMPVLVAISAPTTLAVATARQAGLNLISLDCDLQPVVYVAPDISTSTQEAHTQGQTF
jgi:FdhD protein